ncbi:pyridoxal 5'-phosphate synthase glutaminase subunit PdxT [Arthrobacter sp. AQ5-05]|uniref:pyridoxal 5'-phosphate synthase glutaminase subunit PdxT n=1 Tax=Arthrobacter sp. AQ5-05 TaxID=2184581 RepID=UPI000DCEBE74|nr:pyridoxal 5'-phosphate synthase glutaminase subunit PdxT [Arthrobacter sp. AQ5-05]RAX49644.1 pyridoxal 5'-phosphate synthase glutaminase subunit PdxT [Arthrobacter sp. AQ5-05]
MAPRIGVLALQGDVREHLQALESLGALALPVKTPGALADLDGLVIPGGESTVIDKLARMYGVAEALKARIADGFPVYGSCAGMILLADTIADPTTNMKGEPQQSFGGIDMVVKRNAFGRQVDSFEVDLAIKGLDTLPSQDPDRATEPVRAAFIRAPWVESVGESVEVLATIPAENTPLGVDGTRVARIVAVRSGKLLATSFHPEVAGERRIHELFIQMIRGDA